MNITEIKTKEETFIDLILGTEESNKDTQRNPRQDNSKNKITFKQTSSNHQNNESEEIGDTLVEVLTTINRRTSSTETIIVPETQDNDRMNSCLVNSPSQ